MGRAEKAQTCQSSVMHHAESTPDSGPAATFRVRTVCAGVPVDLDASNGPQFAVESNPSVVMQLAQIPVERLVGAAVGVLASAGVVVMEVVERSEGPGAAEPLPVTATEAVCLVGAVASVRVVAASLTRFACANGRKGEVSDQC